jgi:phosphopantothenoylcysteine decarboxylase/phosphopantothenate--cysteine ligase
MAHDRPSQPAPRPEDREAGTPLRALVAAGPTHEPIDDVRYIGNRSSGRMGAAIAEALREAGCRVTFCRGPGVAEVPGCRDARFRTAGELLSALRAEWPDHDVLVMAAAVADFRPARAVAGKMRRESGRTTLELEPTEDILASLASERRPGQFVVGFALERPEELEASARAKLLRKGADAIVANPLETMDSSDVDATVLLADGTRLSPGGRMPKRSFASWLAAQVVPRAAAQRAARG